MITAQARSLNSPPNAVNDTFTCHGNIYDDPTKNVLANDSDPDGGTLYTPTINFSTPHGYGDVYGSGFLRYTPHSGYVGTDTFTYTVCDNLNACSSATVTINVVNQAPTATGDTFTCHGNIYDDPTKNVLANDSDSDGDSIYSAYPSGYFSTPHGQAVVFGGGLLWYTPHRGYVGTDTFTYTLCDNLGLCSVGSVTINVVNQVPVAASDTFECHGSIYGDPSKNVLANDSDPENDPLSVTVPSPIGYTYSAHGRAYIDSGGNFEYVPHQGYVGIDTLTYQVCDNLNACSNGTVVISVNNGAPNAGSDSFDCPINQGIPASSGKNVLANDSDPENDPLSVTVPSPIGYTYSAHGRAYIDSGGNFEYAPHQGYVGIDTLTYQVCDNLVACSTATVTIYVGGQKEDDENSGTTSCNAKVGGPINVTNGNMYLQQTDYKLPGIGEAIEVTRTYNSNSQQINLFGRGWSTAYDVRIKIDNPNQPRLYMPDGRAIPFSRSGTTDSFSPAAPDFHGQLTRNADGSYTLTLKGGGNYQFNAIGKLTSLADRSNNQTILSYEAGNSLTSITDAFGRVLMIGSDASGRVASISDGLGTIATYTYGSSNELLSVVYADGSKFGFTYATVNSKLVLTTVTDAFDNILEAHTYDALGRALTSEKHGGVERVTLNYLSDSETQVTDALGHVTKYFFVKSNARNVVTRVEGSCSCGSSQTQTWTYDGAQNVTAKTDALGHAVTFTYDAAGNQLTATDVLGTASATYNSFGQMLTSTDVMGGVTTSTYDAQGKVLTTRNAVGETTTFTYDARGLVLSVTDARSNATRLAYDASGNLVQATDAAGSTTRFAYDARGRLMTKTDALGHVTSYAYDAAGRVNKITQPDNSFVTFTYDLAGRRTTATDARGHSTTYLYDEAYRLINETDAAGQVTIYSYDLMSNLTDKTDALGRTTNFEYDDFNRLIKTIYPAATPDATRLTETVEYDAVGNVTKRTDQEGRTTNYTYDTSNRPTKTTDPLLQVTEFDYNARSQVTALMDAAGQRYTFTYDSVGRTTGTSRGGASMSFVYDAAGNRAQRTDYHGAITNYSYDSLNRLTAISYPNGTTVAYAYDGLSRMTAATNQHGTVVMSYDTLSRVGSSRDVWGRTISYTYDANGNRTQMSLGATSTTTYAYDTLNRLAQLTSNATGATTYGYDASGKLISRRLPNAVVSSYGYDGLDRLTQLKHAKGLTSLADYQYEHNATNQITQINEQAGTHVYGYDGLDRLTSATHPPPPANQPPQPQESYAYDAVGNRTNSHRSSAYSYQPTNRLTSTSTATYTYDANGNLTTKTDSSGTWQYVWDTENRLVQVRRGSLTVSYKYDALGRRIEQSASGGWLRFTYDGADVVVDRAGYGAQTLVTTEYTNGLGVDNKLAQRTSVTGTGGSVTLYYVADHQGSTRALVNAAGNVVERQQYDAFGNSTGSLLSRYGYTGRERDALTGLYYYRARWYDPTQGRFISEDPIGFAGGVNWYAYVSNNPANKIDPSGLDDADYPVAQRPYNYPDQPVPHAPDPPALTHWATDVASDAFFRYQNPTSLNPDPYDGAYRHCVTACLLTRRYGPFGTLMIWTWDAFYESSGRPDSPTDMEAERIGGNICAAGRDTCVQECLKKYPRLN